MTAPPGTTTTEGTEDTESLGNPESPEGPEGSESAATDADRDELARQQTALLAALVAGGTVPAGFDAERIRIQTIALAAKRREGVLRALPELAEGLGERWPGAFMDWACTHPKPAEGGSRADAAAFTEYLRAQGTLPQSVEEALTPAPQHPLPRPGFMARVRAALGRRSTGWDDSDDTY
ncbi:hypothetical protein LZ495_03325 [Yinghuangia sp. KLBMP8922]|uniref:SCO6045-like C-terminal domain-containing protein n=1 Tax=Yinghuangia soli TaxID=2908204 RepID=A0AA41PUS7_9ACTN|nr:hypothetical protein [Yinghuangia soli]MCF2526253.1 hypothetical protein [Yinghuangia soli]